MLLLLTAELLNEPYITGWKQCAQVGRVSLCFLLEKQPGGFAAMGAGRSPSGSAFVFRPRGEAETALCSYVRVVVVSVIIWGTPHLDHPRTPPPPGPDPGPPVSHLGDWLCQSEAIAPPLKKFSVPPLLGIQISHDIWKNTQLLLDVAITSLLTT